MEDGTKNIVKIILAIATFVVLCIVGGMIGWPSYNVYSQRKEGEAILLS